MQMQSSFSVKLGSIIIMMILFCSCENKNPKDVAVKDSASVLQNNDASNARNRSLTDTSMDKNLLQIQNVLYGLYMRGEDFKTAAGGNSKISFQFCSTNEYPNYLILCGWPFKNNNKYDESRKFFLNKSDQWPLTLNLSEVNILAGQKLPKQSIDIIEQKLRDIEGTEEIIGFKPARRNEDGHIFYYIKVYRSMADFRSQALNFTADTQFNPSPPASDNPNENTDRD
jgi:hypothetical protein